MSRFRAAIAALAVLCAATCSRGDDSPRLIAQADEPPHDHAARDHSFHDHDHGDHAQRGFCRWSMPEYVETRGVTSAKLPDSWSLLWLGAYCIVIIGASLLGGWLPQRFVLSHNRMQVAISLIGGLMLGIGVFHMSYAARSGGTGAGRSRSGGTRNDGRPRRDVLFAPRVPFSSPWHARFAASRARIARPVSARDGSRSRSRA